MLYRFCGKFLEYCRLADFSNRSIQALEIRLGELRAFARARKLKSIKDIKYLHLVAFTAEFNHPSVHVRKSRVWTLRQFYHFLSLHGYAQNIAKKLPYPKIDKTVPRFLTQDEYNRLICHFSSRATTDLRGHRNLVIILLLGTLGLRTSTLLTLNVTDVDSSCGLIWLQEKGRRTRSLILPQILCEIIEHYLNLLERKQAPLFTTRKGKRISQRTLQNIFRDAADRLNIKKPLHARLFRHTAATHLTRVADIDITQNVLGHSRRANTIKYAHLNPDQYAVYMKRHPYMCDCLNTNHSGRCARKETLCRP